MSLFGRDKHEDEGTALPPDDDQDLLFGEPENESRQSEDFEPDESGFRLEPTEEGEEAPAVADYLEKVTGRGVEKVIITDPVQDEVATPEAEAASVGLYGKFHVERADGRDRPGGDKADARYFVLDYAQDPVARVALRAYIEELKDQGIEPELAEDLSRELSQTRKSFQAKQQQKG